MLSNTLVVGGKLLTRIKEGDYSSEYRYVSSVEEYALFIRHSKAKPTPEGLDRDRHNVELVIRTFPTETTPLVVKKTYMVVEQNANDVITTCSFALLALLTSNENAILNAVHLWDS